MAETTCWYKGLEDAPKSPICCGDGLPAVGRVLDQRVEQQKHTDSPSPVYTGSIFALIERTMTSLSTKLAEREASGNQIQVGVIGAGKFGSMFISQSHRSPGIRLAAIADLSKDRALAALRRTGYPAERYDGDARLSIAEGIKAGKTAITTDSAALIATPGIDVILEVTGSPAAGIKHALLVGS